MSGNSLPRLGDYLLVERVGEGGMAEVFRAQYSGEDHSVGPQSLVVVKRIKPELFNKPEFPIFREMFLNEAKLVRSLQHPNLARVYALLEAFDPDLKQKVPFIVQEYVRGQQLWELLRIATRGFTGLGVPPGVAAFICREMSRGLGHAHTHTDAVTGRLQPIIHRDISPENVMVSAEGHVKVIDFGVAKALGGFGPQTRTGIIKGKLAYMAPEQVAQNVVPATDVFGAAIVLHEMLTGRRLFGGHNDFMVISRVLKAEIPRPSQLQSGIPKELDDVVMTALSRDLKVRYRDGNTFAEALTQVMAQLPDMRGMSNATIKLWAKQVVAEGIKISSNWGEEESGVHVDVDVTGALRRVEASGDDIIELTADDLMRAELEGTFDPGVRAAVTQGLKTLRPDMLASRNSLNPVNPYADGGSSGVGISGASLPGFARAGAGKPAAASELVTPTPTSSAPVRPPSVGNAPVRATPPPNVGNAPVRATTPPNVGNAPVRATPPPNIGNAPVRATPPPNIGNAPVRATPPPNVGTPIIPASGSPSANSHPPALRDPSGIGTAARAGDPSASSNPSGLLSAARLGIPSGNSPPSANSQPSAHGPPAANSHPPTSGVPTSGRHAPPTVTPPGVNPPPGPLAAPSPGPVAGDAGHPVGAPPAARAASHRSPVAPPAAAQVPTPAGVHPAFSDKQVERWIKLIAALVVLALVLVVLLILRD